MVAVEASAGKRQDQPSRAKCSSWDSEYGALAAVMDLGRFARLVVVGVSSSEGGAADLLAVT